MSQLNGRATHRSKMAQWLIWYPFSVRMKLVATSNIRNWQQSTHASSCLENSSIFMHIVSLYCVASVNICSLKVIRSAAIGDISRSTFSIIQPFFCALSLSSLLSSIYFDSIQQDIYYGWVCVLSSVRKMCIVNIARRKDVCIHSAPSPWRLVQRK